MHLLVHIFFYNRQIVKLLYTQTQSVALLLRRQAVKTELNYIATYNFTFCKFCIYWAALKGTAWNERSHSCSRVDPLLLSHRLRLRKPFWRRYNWVCLVDSDTTVSPKAINRRSLSFGPSRSCHLLPFFSSELMNFFFRWLPTSHGIMATFTAGCFCHRKTPKLQTNKKTEAAFFSFFTAWWFNSN